MTRVSEDGNQDKRKLKPPAQNPVSAGTGGDKERILILPELSIKDPMLGGMEDTFPSGIGSGPRSVASSRTRNMAGGKYQTAGSHKRALSNAISKSTSKPGNITSRYRQGMIPTDNLKFNQFMDILFSSKMTRDEIKEEACGYIQVLETNYTDKITQLRVALEKQKKLTNVEKTKSVS